MKSFDWIAELNDDAKTEILRHASECSLARDTVFHHGGELATHIHQVVDGRVRQFMLDENGNEILVHIYTSGDVVGAGLGLLGVPHPLWLSTDGVVTSRRWSVEFLTQLRIKDRSVDAALSAQTANNFRMAIALFTDFATLDASGKVAGRLCHLSDYARTKGFPYLDSSQEDLALMANVSRQTVNKVVAELTEQDIVRGGYGKILIKDVGALNCYKTIHRRRP